MITVDQALSTVLGEVQPLGSESVALQEAYRRIISEDVVADINLPPFDRSRMDGYAVRSSDVTTVPVTLRVIGEIAAGAQFEQRVNSGEAVKIFTGAPVPEGADAVQKVEVTRANGQSVEVLERVEPGQFITPHASEVAAGERVARAGCEIGPAEMAVLASFGYSTVKVGRRPRVAVMSTGSELVDVSSKPSGAQIRNSNSYTLGAYSERNGALTDILGTVQDSPEATREALISAAVNRDIVITSGGVSMGDYDLVKAALKDIGAEIYFDKVRVRPGKPIVFAKRANTYYFGLPGNPVSTSVTFNLFVRPAIRAMQGDASPAPPVFRARLSGPVKDPSNRRSYLPARLSIQEGRAEVQPLKWGGSSDLVAFMRANAMIVVEENMHEIAEGMLVDVVML